jgi:hypothetical protein
VNSPGKQCSRDNKDYQFSRISLFFCFSSKYVKNIRIFVPKLQSMNTIQCMLCENFISAVDFLSHISLYYHQICEKNRLYHYIYAISVKNDRNVWL